MPKTVMNFVCDRSNWIGNLLFAHLLFWYFGFQAFLDYSYGDDAGSANSAGAIVSGPSGSGVFPVTLVLMLVATFSVSSQFVSFVVVLAGVAVRSRSLVSQRIT